MSGAKGGCAFLTTTSPPSFPSSSLFFFFCFSRRSAVILDSAGECASISLYHLGERHLPLLGDRDKHSVVVLDPVLKSVRLSSSATAGAGAGAAGAGSGASTAAPGGAIAYKCVQVMKADGFFVDGKGVSKDLVAAASSFSIEAFDR